MSAFSISSRLVLVLPFLALAACGQTPEPEPVPVQQTLPGIDPVTGQAIDLTPGLNDREPNTCHMEEAQFLMGQPGAAVAGAGLTRVTRLIPMGEIFDQEEYQSGRVNFFLDATGTIVHISCG